MALIAIDAKHKIKRSTIPGVVPVIGTSEDHTDGSWTDNMIYPGELFLNIPDRKVWIGITAGVLEIYSPSSVSLAFADQTITPGLGERKITLSGSTVADVLGIYNDNGDEVAKFYGDQTVSLYKTLYVAQDIVGQQQVRANVVNGAPVTLRDLVGSPTVGAIYGFDTSYSSNNYRHFYNSGTTSINASTTVTLQTAGLDRLTVAATGIFTRSGLSLSVGKGSAAHSTFEVNGSVADKLKIINTATTLGINDNTVVCNSANFTVTLPSAVGIRGRKYTIVNNSAFQIQVSEASGQKINGDDIWYLQFDGAFVTVESNDTNWIVVGCKQRDCFSVTVKTAGTTYQNNLLLGARSINMIVRNGTITQAPFTFNATNGTVTFTVAVDDLLTVFYTPQ